MSSMMKSMFVIFLMLNSMPRINGYPKRLIFGDHLNDDYPITSERQIDNEEMHDDLKFAAEVKQIVAPVDEVLRDLMKYINEEDKPTAVKILYDLSEVEAKKCMKAANLPPEENNDGTDPFFIGDKESTAQQLYNELMNKFSQSAQNMFDKALKVFKNAALEACRLRKEQPEQYRRYFYW